MAIVRALTFFIPCKGEMDYTDLEKYYSRSMELLNDTNINPWTIRFVFPPINKSGLNKLDSHKIDKIYSVFSSNDKYLVNALPIISNSMDIVRLGDLLSNYPKLYSTIYLDNLDKLDGIIDYLYMRDYEPDIYTRVSIAHYRFIETPYFPNTANIENRYGFSIALRYVDLFKKFLKNDYTIFEYLSRLKEKISGYSDLFLGIDYSLSPWMDESVCNVIEEYSGIKLGDVGSYSGVFEINRKIRYIIEESGVEEFGYNEVMLPVGEDNLLKERVKEQSIKLETLIGLSSVCVAGLDMTAVPRIKNLIIRILKDMDSIAHTKARSLGSRIIPVNPGESKVYIKRFGEIPVIQ